MKPSRINRLAGLLAAGTLIATGCAGPDASGRRQQDVITRLEQFHEDQARETRPQTPNHLALARNLMAQGHYRVALVQLRHAVKDAPDRPEILYRIGVCHRELDDLETAGEWFLKTIRLDDQYAPAYNGMGLTVQRMGQADLACRSFRQAVDIDPAVADYYNNLGYVLMKNDRPGEAEKIFRRGLAINPDLVVIRNNLAICLGMQEKDGEALGILLETHPPAVAYRNMSAICHMRGDLDKAGALRAQAEKKARIMGGE